MIHDLAQSNIQQFIRDHENDDVRELVLKKAFIEGTPSSVIANQIACRRKAKEKLPLWYNTAGIIYPPMVNLEQASSEITAQFKYEVLTNRINPPFPRIKGGVGVDLTGGFGVDSFFISQSFGQFHYVESNAELVEIARHNHRQLGSTNITHHCTAAEEFLQAFPGTIDFIYLDPSRRTTGSKKVVQLSDCLPDVPALLPALLERSSLVLIKTSPLLDIQRGLNGLRSVRNVFVVSVANDCKEVLYLCQSGFSGEPVIHAVNLQSPDDEFTFCISEEKKAAVEFSYPLAYLFEPNSSLMKAGAFKVTAERYGLFKLHKNTHIYTSDKLSYEFPGRIFKIKSLVTPSEIKTVFATKQANIISRNYPLTAEQLKKKLHLRDGGSDYLIAVAGLKKKYLVAAGRIK
ncbi:MAG: class I SAM-dependent methyltransferase [Flammeovirgaceae bacterium]|nr:MAG: class I SAM-dependent methyltransferase [Flammeovirgaceae bacterium]